MRLNKCLRRFVKSCAEVAELVDALGSGSSGGSPVGVQVSPSAPSFFSEFSFSENRRHTCRDKIAAGSSPCCPSLGCHCGDTSCVSLRCALPHIFPHAIDQIFHGEGFGQNGVKMLSVRQPGGGEDADDRKRCSCKISNTPHHVHAIQLGQQDIGYN